MITQMSKINSKITDICEMKADRGKITRSDARTPRLISDEHSSILKHLCLYKPLGRIITMRRSSITPVVTVPSVILGSPDVLTIETISNTILDNNKSPVQNRPLGVNGPVYASMNGLSRFTHENNLYFCSHLRKRRHSE